MIAQQPLKGKVLAINKIPVVTYYCPICGKLIKITMKSNY